MELNLTQRADLQNNQRFQQRLRVAVAKTANYWKQYSVSTFEQYNEAVRKRKEFARKILDGSGFSSQYISDFILNYNNSAPVLENDELEFNASTNQLADSELTDSSTTALVFDRQAGVLAGDETKQIIL